MDVITPGGDDVPLAVSVASPIRVERRNDKNGKKQGVPVHIVLPALASLADTPRRRRYCFVLDLIFDLA